MATANTVLSDINEIYIGYVVNKNQWYDSEAKNQFNLRCKQATPDEVSDAIGKSKVMATEFLAWAKENGYKTPIKGVWWTARPNSITAIVGYPVDQRKNPTDILIKFSSGPADGFLGLSAKATQGKGEIGFKNPGLGTIDRNLNMSLVNESKKILDLAIAKFDLPETAEKRKAHIRSNAGIKKITEEVGVQLLAALRDELYKKLLTLDQKKLLKYLLSDWMDAEVIKPPYIKVTGMGSKEPYTAEVVDPTKNEKLDALGKHKITLEKVGNESIGVKAGDKKIMKIRFKYESEKLASSLKLSGEPW